MAGASTNSSFSVFEIVIELTEEGFKKKWQVVDIVFSYLQMLKEEGSKEWVYNEIKAIDEIQFKFKDKESPESFASSLSQRMQKYEYVHLLDGPYYFQSYNPDLINSLMNQYLTPQNLRIYLVSKGFFFFFFHFYFRLKIILFLFLLFVF